MYLLFRHLKWPPSRYAFMDSGERLIVKAFTRYMIDEMIAEQESAKG
jgi:hypothetical protein